MKKNARIAVVIDSFKGSMSSLEAGKAAAAGIKKVFPEADVHVLPAADGGEGTARALALGCGGKMVNVRVTGPMGVKVKAEYGILPNNTAVLEMASAAGLAIVVGEKNPKKATTYGVGEMIADAARKGCRKFIIGIGGSATNDGGAGMLRALGYRFLRADGSDIPDRDVCALEEIAEVDDIGVPDYVHKLEFCVACDVTNPLCGPKGASAVFGKQKGAGPDLIAKFDKALAHYARVLGEYFGGVDSNTPGAGAAGGMGFAFKCLGAELTPGAELVIRETGLEAELAAADLVITGEGRLDAQTAMGKTPTTIARTAKKYGKPVIGFSGILGDGAEALLDVGMDAYFPIINRIMSLEDAMDLDNAMANMTKTVEQVMRVLEMNS